MEEGRIHFNNRLRLLDRKHRAKGRGYTTVMQPDGLIVAKPHGTRIRIPVKPVILCILGLFLFKGYLMSQLGASVYAERVARLEAGTIVEQAGAFVMRTDPVSERIALQLKALLR